jgi:Uma2 family endonuclease
MATGIHTLADMLHDLGDIPPERIRWKPHPGTATEKDLLRVMAEEKVLLELVDGILVEKAVGYYSSRIAIVLAYLIEHFLEEHDLGIVVGADGAIRLAPGLIREPDVAFFPWRLFPGRLVPDRPIPSLAPTLAVEVLSESNTPGEMQRKFREYFDAGVELVWEIDPESRSARVFTAPEEFEELAETGVLEGRDVLPGFRLPLRQLFTRARLKPRSNAKRRKGRRSAD